MINAAREAFREHGFDVPLDEIARLAGVGPGTVHRHFPAKTDLVDAVLASVVAELAGYAEARLDDEDPGLALRTVLEHVVGAGAAAHALSHRLGRPAEEVDRAVAEPLAALNGALSTLRARAVQAGEVRADLDDATVSAVIAAAHAAFTHERGGRRAMRVVLDGLIAEPDPG
ncbi:TetR/AcrR family transcriptional regulator [Microlunatus parietis]|uniref:AcrR family transcriptional regulator n=1 Tax=Microlunatus parietis TaxID=682979 RepID=A0A7Y9LF65_9ACTN|nr:TetR/AcrR family transcriptional regulator [Microlunatus parietis]NYE73786.1 AcrR family transcriptional regulator [Microlunatus parietis]